MSAEIEVNGIKATITGYKWECEDPITLAILNSLLNPNGVGGEDPNPDATAAHNAVDLFNKHGSKAKVIRYDDWPVVEGRIY